MIQNLTKYINIILLLLIAIFPFSLALSNILLVVSVVLILINLILSKKKISFNTPLILFTVSLGFILLTCAFQGSFEANKNIWKFVPILLLGFLSICQLDRLDFKKFKDLSILSCGLYIVYALINTVLFYIEHQYLPFGNNHEINEVITIHRPYLGFYVLLNIYFCFDQYLKTNNRFYFIPFVLFIGFLILILARLSILTLVISFLVYLLFYAKWPLKNKAITLASGITIIGLFTVLNPKFTERMNHQSWENFVDYEPRFIIWKSVKNITSNEDFNPLLGYGNENLIEEYLVINYADLISKDDKREYYLAERFNTHSQFLNYLILGGYLQIILFVGFFISLFIYFRKEYLSTIILISFVLFLNVENLFVRQFGCFLFILYLGYAFVHIKTNKTSP